MFPSNRDAFLSWTIYGCGVFSAAIVVLILGFLIKESAPTLYHLDILRFFTDPSWHPSSSPPEYNLLPLIVATLLTTLGAIVIAAPLGIGSAIFSHFYASRVVGRAYGKVIELLAGIPSVVYGLWGLTVLVPLVSQWQPPGASLFTAIVILSIMILPTIALFAGAAFESLPKEHLQAAEALGLSRSRIVISVVLPASRTGLFTAIILGTGRAVGETMAVLMVAGNVVQTPYSLFQPVRTITANIALEMAYAMGDHRGALFVCGLLLMGIVIVLVSVAEWVSRGRVYG